MNAYQQLKSRQQARVDAFPLGAAFSDKQFTEMMKYRFGLQDTPEDRQWKLAKQARDNFWRQCCENDWF